MARFVNLKGDLFATGFSFSIQAIIKLGSSLILTRLLQPEAYGIITILLSVVYVIEMLSDIAITVPLVRHPNGEDPHFLNTAWTLRLIRSVINGAIVFACASLIARLYGTPALTNPLHVFAIWFIFGGFESITFPIAIRRKNSRIVVYSELVATAAATVFTVVYCHYSRNYWGMVYGILFNRLLLTAMSHAFYRELRPKLEINRAAAKELLSYSKFSLPSSMLGVCLSQFDKVVFLRLFDLRSLGVYGLANNIAGPIENLISKISQLVLYPRCAHNYRQDPTTFTLKYYIENAKLWVGILAIPAAMGGAAHLLIGVLYDLRYAQAATFLQAFMVRAALLSLAAPAEDLLIASGEYQVILVGNICRAVWMVCASLIGYYFFGIIGFTYGAALSGAPPLIYYLCLQKRKNFLIARYEIYKVAFTCTVALVAYAASTLILPIVPAVRAFLRTGLHSGL